MLMTKEEISSLREQALEFIEVEDLRLKLSVPARHVLFLIEQNSRMREALESVASELNDDEWSRDIACTALEVK